MPGMKIKPAKSIREELIAIEHRVSKGLLGSGWAYPHDELLGLLRAIARDVEDAKKRIVDTQMTFVCKMNEIDRRIRALETKGNDE